MRGPRGVALAALALAALSAIATVAVSWTPAASFAARAFGVAREGR